MLVAIGLSGLIVGGCVQGTPGTHPDDMSAEGHREEAQRHEAEARAHERRADDLPLGSTVDSLRYPQEFEIEEPAERHLRIADYHRQHAREHLEAARALEQFEEGECEAFPPTVRAVCPLVGRVKAVEDTRGGAEIVLSEAVDPADAVAHMRCHIAFGRSRGHAGMKTCPLYIPGVRAEFSSRPRRVDLLVDPGERDALRDGLRQLRDPAP